MSYPQPQADAYAVGSSQFFRLNTLLSSPGDIYQSSQGGLAFALGPDSDVSRVRVAYFDSNVPVTPGGAPQTLMGQFVIDHQRPFMGRIAAANDAQYQPSLRPGKIMLWSDDLFDPSYVPSTAVGFTAGDNVMTINPRLDVIEYFSVPPSLNPGRVDKQYYFQSYVINAKTTWMVIPAYGRRYGTVEITNKDTALTLTFKVIGVNYAMGASPTAVPFHQEKVISTGALAPGAQITTNNFLGVGGGMYDAVVVCASGDSMPMRVYLSDS